MERICSLICSLRSCPHVLVAFTQSVRILYIYWLVRSVRRLATSGRRVERRCIKHIDLFSGIGGFALATEMVWDNVEHIFCDNEPFAQAIIKKHWPNSKIYGDIRELRGDNSRPFLLTGGFPCQPFSQAGQRRGTEDDRYLWPEMLRVIQEFQPTWVIAENVRGLLSISGGMVFEKVCTDLEDAGYDVQPIVIPAVAVNAPHRRDRVWIVAHSQHKSERNAKCGGIDERTSVGTSRPNTDVADATSDGCEWGRKNTERQSSELNRARSNERREWDKYWYEIAAALCRVDDGVPRRLDRNPRLKALGNAIVPQVAEEIMKAIAATEQ